MYGFLLRLLSGALTLGLIVSLSVAFDRPAPAHASTAVATPSSPASTVAGFTAIGSGLSISGFSADIRVVISTDDASGELKLASATGLTNVAGYDNTSSLTDSGNEIAFEGSQTNANTALSGLQYKGANAGSDIISIEVLDKGIVPVELSGVYHYYGLSAGSTTYTYANAKTGAATSRMINGTSVTPWLATVGSREENLAISNYVDADAWIGGEVTLTSGGTRTWSWVTSNTADGLSTVSFATDTHDSLPCVAPPRGGTATENGYQNWYDYRDTTLTIDTTGLEFTEPNNCSGGAAETRLIMYQQRKNADGSTWNDVGEAGPFKYIWEYASATPLSLNATFTTVVSDPSAAGSGSGSSDSSIDGQGIFLYLAGRPVSPVDGCPVYYGPVSIKPNTTYILSIQSVTNPALTRTVLATGTTNDWGHADKRLEMGKLAPGTYKVVMTGTHRLDYPLVLTNYISVDRNGNFISLSPESLQPTLS